MTSLLCATCNGPMAEIKDDPQGRVVCFECGSFTCRCPPRATARRPLPSASTLEPLDSFSRRRA